jgi:hypothetical protein
MTFRSVLRKARITLAATAIAVTGTVFIPGVAQAASACHATTRTFTIPGALDPEVTVTLCVRTSGSNVYATALVEWDRASLGNMGDPDFESFLLNLRLERSDASIRAASCNVNAAINSHRDGQLGCTTSQVAKGSSTAWTADGAVSFNIDNDGLGAQPWELHGSPAI